MRSVSEIGPFLRLGVWSCGRVRMVVIFGCGVAGIFVAVGWWGRWVAMEGGAVGWLSRVVGYPADGSRSFYGDVLNEPRGI